MEASSATLPIFNQTQTKNIAGLVVYAIQNNIITLNEIDL